MESKSRKDMQQQFQAVYGCSSEAHVFTAASRLEQLPPKTLKEKICNGIVESPNAGLLKPLLQESSRSKQSCCSAFVLTFVATGQKAKQREKVLSLLRQGSMTKTIT